MITYREEPSLSASERLAAIAELFARGVQRLLATRKRGHSAAGEEATLRSTTRERSAPGSVRQNLHSAGVVSIATIAPEKIQTFFTGTCPVSAWGRLVH